MVKSLMDVRIQILTCTRCGLNSNCNSPIPIAADDLNAIRYLVLGEAPGKIEDLKGEPFRGPAGSFLRKSLRRAGLRPSDAGYLNAVCCFPAEEKTPTPVEISACRGNLYDQLDAVEASCVLVVGSTALTALLPNAVLTYSMGAPIEAHDKMLFPVYHPAYILRSSGREIGALWLRHLARFADMVNGVRTTRQSLGYSNCIYCSAMVLPARYYCARHESKWESDIVRKRPRNIPPPQLQLDI